MDIVGMEHSLPDELHLRTCIGRRSLGLFHIWNIQNNHIVEVHFWNVNREFILFNFGGIKAIYLSLWKALCAFRKLNLAKLYSSYLLVVKQCFRKWKVKKNTMYRFYLRIVSLKPGMLISDSNYFRNSWYNKIVLFCVCWNSTCQKSETQCLAEC